MNNTDRDEFEKELYEILGNHWNPLFEEPLWQWIEDYAQKKSLEDQKNFLLEMKAQAKKDFSTNICRRISDIDWTLRWIDRKLKKLKSS